MHLSAYMLYVDNCGLSRVPGEVSKVACSLHKLILPRNKLRELPSEIVSLTALQQLDIRFSMILPTFFSLYLLHASELAQRDCANTHTLWSHSLTPLPVTLCPTNAYSFERNFEISHNMLERLDALTLPKLRDCVLSHNRLSGV